MSPPPADPLRPALSPRTAAHAVLGAWFPEGGAHADDLLAQATGSLDARDQRLAWRLVEDTLRHLRLLDHWIDALATRSRPLDPGVRHALRLGLVQLRFLRIPPHAAVDASVRLVPGRARGFANAILRRAARDPGHLDELARTAPDAVRHSLPDALWDRWTTALGVEGAAARAEAANTPAPASFVVNGFHPDARALADDPRVRPLPGHPGYLVMEDGPVPDAWLEDGLVYIQDPGAGLASRLADPRPGEAVLDACAAPGGKTRHLAELAGGNARITAADRSAARLAVLEENIRRLRLPGITTRLADWDHPGEPGPAYDAALVDVPCTNTGVLRRRIDARHRFSQAALAAACRGQAAILAAVATTVRPGGRLVYATCSLEQEENEGVVEAFLADHPGWKPVTTRQTLPEVDNCDGHFAALLSRE